MNYVLKNNLFPSLCILFSERFFSYWGDFKYSVFGTQFFWGRDFSFAWYVSGLYFTGWNPNGLYCESFWWQKSRDFWNGFLHPCGFSLVVCHKFFGLRVRSDSICSFCGIFIWQFFVFSEWIFSTFLKKLCRNSLPNAFSWVNCWTSFDFDRDSNAPPMIWKYFSHSNFYHPFCSHTLRIFANICRRQ